MRGNSDGLASLPFWIPILLSLSAGCTPSLLTGPDFCRYPKPRTCSRYDWASARILFHSKMSVTGAWDTAGTSSYNVWLASLDSATRTPLTQNTAAAHDANFAVFSPNQSHVTFNTAHVFSTAWNGGANANANVVRMDRTYSGTGSDISQFPGQNTTGGIHSYNPIFNPDSTKILYYSRGNVTNGPGYAANAAPYPVTYNLWLMNLDGTSRAPLTFNTVASHSAVYPVFSESGTTIYFISRQPITTTTSSWDVMPNLSNMNIWRINTDGTNMIALTRNDSTVTAGMDSGATVGLVYGGVDVFPGSRHLIVSSQMSLSTTRSNWNVQPASSWNLWRISADYTEDPVPLTRETNVNGVSWSPQFFNYRGVDWIAYSSNSATDGTYGGLNANNIENVWIMRADGQCRKALTSYTVAGGTPTNGASVRVSPDGSRIAFNAKYPMTTGGDFDPTGTTSPSDNIWVVNVDGTGLKAVTRNRSVAALDTALSARGGVWYLPNQADCD